MCISASVWIFVCFFSNFNLANTIAIQKCFTFLIMKEIYYLWRWILQPIIFFLFFGRNYNSLINLLQWFLSIKYHLHSIYILKSINFILLVDLLCLFLLNISFDWIWSLRFLFLTLVRMFFHHFIYIEVRGDNFWYNNLEFFIVFYFKTFFLISF